MNTTSNKATNSEVNQSVSRAVGKSVKLDDAITAELAKRGIDRAELDIAPEPMEKEQKPYDGVRFFIPVNDAKKGDSVTMHVVHGTWSRRENKRRLRKYLKAMGYTDKGEQKRILKELGFWTKTQLGTVV